MVPFGKYFILSVSKNFIRVFILVKFTSNVGLWKKSFTNIFKKNFRKVSKYARNATKYKPYYLKNHPTMRIDNELEVIKDWYKEELNVWREIGKL